jgi:ribosomal protein S27AE
VLRSRLPFEGRIMQKPYFLPDYVSVSIHRPVCPECGAFTMLARIMPGRVGFDFRTFECPQCDHVHEVMVATEAFGRSFTPLA